MSGGQLVVSSIGTFQGQQHASALSAPQPPPQISFTPAPGPAGRELGIEARDPEVHEDVLALGSSQIRSDGGHSVDGHDDLESEWNDENEHDLENSSPAQLNVPSSQAPSSQALQPLTISSQAQVGSERLFAILSIGPFYLEITHMSCMLNHF
jgi:hypothetical protein